jgi:hypothetical protein
MLRTWIEPGSYSTQLGAYTEAETEKHISSVEMMTSSMTRVMEAIARLGGGYLPPQIITPAGGCG